MKASELLKVLEGVPDEALPHEFRKTCVSADMEEKYLGWWLRPTLPHAAVGAMVAWLAQQCTAGRGWLEVRERDGEWTVNCEVWPETIRSGKSPSLLEALAAACRAVTATRSRA